MKYTTQTLNRFFRNIYDVWRDLKKSLYILLYSYDKKDIYVSLSFCNLAFTVYCQHAVWHYLVWLDDMTVEMCYEVSCFFFCFFLQDTIVWTHIIRTSYVKTQVPGLLDCIKHTLLIFALFWVSFLPLYEPGKLTFLKGCLTRLPAKLP